jgi:hypothetical protein
VLAGRYTSYTIWPQNTAVIHWQKEQNICLNKQKLKSQWSFIVARTEFVKKYAKIKKKQWYLVAKEYIEFFLNKPLQDH